MIDASNVTSIESGLADIGVNTGLEKADALATLNLLSQTKEEWLLLFDNADDPHLDLRPYFPSCTHGNILITTRNRTCIIHAPDANNSVSEMQNDEAVTLLLRTAMKSTNEVNVVSATVVVEELGYLALAIVQAVSYIVAQMCSLSEYLALFKGRRTELMEMKSIQKADHYGSAVHTTWEINFDKLSTEAQGLFNLCAFLNRDGISKELFRRAVISSHGAVPLRESIDLDPSAINWIQQLTTSEREFGGHQLGLLIGELSSVTDNLKQ